MALAQELLDILRCPESKAELIYFPDGAPGYGDAFLFCPTSRLLYAIDEHGIPVMLIEEARRLSESESQALVERARELGLTVG